MGKIFASMRNAPKRTSAILAMIAAAVIVPATLFAWGPNRDTYTIQHPADHVVFNSITNNPSHGDERNFMQVREKTASNTTYSDEISLSAGKEYVIYMYYHNNAASNLNDAAHNYKGIAKDVMAKAQIPAVVPSGSNGTKAVGYINSSNASPTSVWDDISFKNTTSGDFALRMVPGSATIHNFGKTNGATLSDNIITSGATLGFDKLDGVLPGCNEFAGYVTFRVVADQPNFSVSKKVRKAGTTEWKENVAANPGDKVDYLVEYKNSGTTAQNDVVVKDTLPAKVSYQTGSTKIANPTNPGGVATEDGITSAQGINVGDYPAGSNAFVMFSAKVAGADQLDCGETTLVNKATVETNNGSKSDTATVVVNNGDCAEEEEPYYLCNSMTVSQLSRTKFKFTTDYTAENVVFKNVTYVVKNAAGQEVYRGTNDTFTGVDAGKYSVRAIVTVEVDGETKTVTSEDCFKEFEVKPPTVEPCPVPGKEDLPKDSSDCKETPLTPIELPKTGSAEVVSALIGLSSLIAATSYYIASRRLIIGR